MTYPPPSPHWQPQPPANLPAPLGHRPLPPGYAPPPSAYAAPPPGYAPPPAPAHGLLPQAYAPPLPGYLPAALPQVAVKSSGTAVLLELGPGLLGFFGIGNIYAGATGVGLALMLSFWLFTCVNVMLAFVFIGWFTGPLTWIAYAILGSVLAAREADRYNARLGIR